MPDDFLKQLNNRPKVPARTEEAIPVSQDNVVSPSRDTKITGCQDNEENGISTIRSSLLLEESMHYKFRDLCNKEDIIRACWLEATLILAERDPELMRKIEDLAKDLTLKRKELADDRRRVTMYENRKKSR